MALLPCTHAPQPPAIQLPHLSSSSSSFSSSSISPSHRSRAHLQLLTSLARSPATVGAVAQRQLFCLVCCLFTQLNPSPPEVPSPIFSAMYAYCRVCFGRRRSSGSGLPDGPRAARRELLHMESCRCWGRVGLGGGGVLGVLAHSSCELCFYVLLASWALIALSFSWPGRV
jgi:hypothetical protein